MDRVGRIRDARWSGGQRQHRHLRIQARIEEVRHRDPLCGGTTEVHPMLGRPQVAAGGELEQLAARMQDSVGRFRV